MPHYPFSGKHDRNAMNGELLVVSVSMWARINKWAARQEVTRLPTDRA